MENSQILRTQLLEEKKKLEEELASFAVEDKNNKGNWQAQVQAAPDADLDEKGNEAQEYENLLSLEYSLELKLKDVNAALDKMELNRYGLCEKCGKEISAERLSACPEARFCGDCK